MGSIMRPFKEGTALKPAADLFERDLSNIELYNLLLFRLTEKSNQVVVAPTESGMGSCICSGSLSSSIMATQGPLLLSTAISYFLPHTTLHVLRNPNDGGPRKVSLEILPLLPVIQDCTSCRRYKYSSFINSCLTLAATSTCQRRSSSTRRCALRLIAYAKH
jgi:hypothetical protein